MMVSVIIPFYNNFIWLEKAVESVLSQTYQDYEIIVINDGSIENDSTFLLKFDSRIKYIRTKNQGSASARNLGIEISKGKYIAFLDSDDLWSINKLKIQVDFMESNNYAWSHCSYLTFEDGSNDIINIISVKSFKGDVFLNCLVSSPIATPCVILKREVLLNDMKLRFNINMKNGQDSYLWLKMAETFKLGVIDDCLVKVRIRQGGNTASKARVHLKSKSQIYSVLNDGIAENKLKYANINYFVIFSYRLCFLLDNLMMKVEKRINHVRVIENLSKICYLLPYIVLKIIKKSKLNEYYKN